MKRDKFTPEQKTEYFRSLRQKWNEAKELATHDEAIGAIYHQLGEMGIGDISIYNVSLILMQAASLGLIGLPYVDFKTYEHWQKAGFQVRRGEKSPVFSLTWVGGHSQDDEGNEQDGPRYPKMTHLFHSSQVEPIA